MSNAWIRPLVCLTLMTAGFSALSAPRDLFIAAASDQRLEFESGVRMVVSESRYVVVADVEGIDSKTAWIGLSIFNPESSPVTFMEESVLAQEPLGAMTVLRSADILKKEKRKRMWENIGAGLVAGMNSYNAAQSGNYTASGSFNGQVNTYGSRGSSQSTVDGRYRVSGYDAGAAQVALMRANLENRQLLASVQNGQASREDQLNRILLRSHTIKSGESISGRLQIELPRKIRRATQAFQLYVDIGAERHTFIVFLDGAPTAKDLDDLSRVVAFPGRKAADLKVENVAALRSEAEPNVPTASLGSANANEVIPTSTSPDSVARGPVSSVADKPNSDLIAEWSSRDSTARTLQHQERYEDALVEAMAALSAMERVTPESQQLASALDLVGSLQTSLEQHGAAVATYRRAVGVVERTADPDNEELVESLMALGMALWSADELEQALVVGDRLISISEGMTEASDPVWAGVYAMVGMGYFLGGNLERSESLLLQSIEEFQLSADDDREFVAMVFGVLGAVQLNLGHFTRAELSLSRSLDDFGPLEEEDQSYELLVSLLLLEAQAQNGKSSESESTQKRIVSLHRSLSAKDQADIAIEINELVKMSKKVDWTTISRALERLTSILDGEPPETVVPTSSNNSSEVANHTVDSGATKVTALLKGVSVELGIVYFDVAWHVERGVGEKGHPIVGKLVLSNAANQKSVVMPWPISSTDADAGIFFEQGVGFLQSNLGANARWVGRIGADLSKISLRYEVGSP